MVKKYMYQKIQRLKKQGDWKSEIARNLGIDRGTISKYYDMPESEYRVYQEKVLYRHKLLDNFQDDIIDVYRKNDFRKLNMSAVYDYHKTKQE